MEDTKDSRRRLHDHKRISVAKRQVYKINFEIVIQRTELLSFIQKKKRRIFYRKKPQNNEEI